MRERLVVAFVALAVAVVAVFLVERAHTTAGLVEGEARDEVGRSAEIVAAMAGLAAAPPTGAQLEAVLTAGERIEYVGRDGTTVVADRWPGDAAPPGTGDIVESREVPGAGRITLARHRDVVDAEVAAELLPLVLVALALLVAAGITAVWLARRLSEPFTELAELADRVGRGDFDLPERRHGVAEADAVAGALRSGARALDAVARQERDFAVSASHELRTPITALRLELEDLVLSADTPRATVAGITEALGQLDRLSSSVASLLDRSRESRLGSTVEIDLAALVRDTGARWQRIARRRKVDVAADGLVAARVPAGAVMQVLDVLIGNAVTHGAGRVAVRLAPYDGYAELSVSDEGRREDAFAGSRTLTRGVGGLASANRAAASFGGQLRLGEDESTTVVLAVPLSRRPAVSPDGVPAS